MENKAVSTEKSLVLFNDTWSRGKDIGCHYDILFQLTNHQVRQQATWKVI